jgi:hypothetical protein
VAQCDIASSSALLAICPKDCRTDTSEAAPVSSNLSQGPTPTEFVQVPTPGFEISSAMLDETGRMSDVDWVRIVTIDEPLLERY